MTERTRMIVDVPPEIQMAIKLRAVKNNITTGEVVREAIERAFPKDIEEARIAIREQKQQ